MMAVRTRGFEAEDVADAVEIGLRRFFVDADGAVALHVRMTADRRDARAGLAEIALEEEEVRDLLDESGSPLMLGHDHAVADERLVRAAIDLGEEADFGVLGARNTDAIENS